MNREELEKKILLIRKEFSHITSDDFYSIIYETKFKNAGKEWERDNSLFNYYLNFIRSENLIFKNDKKEILIYLNFYYWVMLNFWDGKIKLLKDKLIKE